MLCRLPIRPLNNKGLPSSPLNQIDLTREIKEVIRRICWWGCSWDTQRMIPHHINVLLFHRIAIERNLRGVVLRILSRMEYQLPSPLVLYHAFWFRKTAEKEEENVKKRKGFKKQQKQREDSFSSAVFSKAAVCFVYYVRSSLAKQNRLNQIVQSSSLLSYQ